MPYSVAIRRGEEILASGAAAPAELLGLAKQLEHERALTLARRLLELGYDRPEVRSDPDKCRCRESRCRRIRLRVAKTYQGRVSRRLGLGDSILLDQSLPLGEDISISRPFGTASMGSALNPASCAME
jgi:hypothetical protein